nr:ComEA family DNA-binding protein [Deinococcus sp. JMULE3]
MDPWTLVLGGAVLLSAAFTLVPALVPQPRVPTVTRAALPVATSPAATSPASATPEAPVYPTTSSITPLISGRVNLNSASLEQLEALPKVGPALASRIVAGRPYRSLADLDRVKGIGPAALKSLEPLVSF